MEAKQELVMSEAAVRRIKELREEDEAEGAGPFCSYSKYTK
jgi:hypothetical protein